ncbi:putative reverse transcriptase domain-containing protein [Tanacetum coccineum]
MPPKRTATTTTTAPMTNAAIKQLISQRVVDALAEIKANKTSRNGDDSHDLGTGSRRTERVARECTYNDFLKCQPLNFKGTDVVSYNQRFQELALMCSRIFPEESDEVEKYVGGLPNMIQGSVMAFDPSVQWQTQWHPAKAYVMGTTVTNPNSNVVTGTFLLNNRYALILFNTGADRIFVYTTFSSLIDIITTILDHDYDVELTDGKIIWVNTLTRGCTLNFLNHPFSIDLMLVEIGSFDVIIGMDWLSKYHDVIVCDEKINRIPFGNEILIVHGDKSNNGHESRLNIISCTKTQKYLLKGCQVFLAHITTKKTEDKSEEKRLEDVPIVRDFPEVFPEDLPAQAPYQLAPSQMKELLDQLQELSDKGFIRPSSSPWGAQDDKQEAAFHLLKEKLCSAPILALPEGAENFIVYCDASHKGLGAFLIQNEKVIAYAS